MERTMPRAADIHRLEKAYDGVRGKLDRCRPPATLSPFVSICNLFPILL